MNIHMVFCGERRKEKPPGQPVTIQLHCLCFATWIFIKPLLCYKPPKYGKQWRKEVTFNLLMTSCHHMRQEVYKINCNAGQSKLKEWKALQVFFFFSKMIRQRNFTNSKPQEDHSELLLRINTQVEGVWKRDSSLRVGSVSFFRGGREE